MEKGGFMCWRLSRQVSGDDSRRSDVVGGGGEAGKLLLLEAGGKVTSKSSHDDKPLTIYSNGILHHAAENLL